MANHLFPMKLFVILNSLIGKQKFEEQKTSLACRYELQIPEGSEDLYFLYSSEVHNAVHKIFGDHYVYSRKRLSVPMNFTVADIDKVKLEIYSRFDGSLLHSEPMVQIQDYLAAAIEVELLSILLREKGIYVPMM